MTVQLAVQTIGFLALAALVLVKDGRDVKARDELMRAVHDMRNLALGAIAQRVDIERRLGAVEQVLGQHDARLIALESRDEDG